MNNEQIWINACNGFINKNSFSYYYSNKKIKSNKKDKIYLYSLYLG